MNMGVAACLVAAFALAGTCAAVPEAGASVPGKWIGSLAADKFGERQRASEKLEEWAGEHPGEACDRFFAESVENPEPEVRKRCLALLREVVLEDFRRDGQGYVGIQMGQVDVPVEGGKFFGVRVSVVVKDTPAQKAGLKAGDVIVELDGKRWSQPGAIAAFQKGVMARKPGEEVRMRIVRPGGEKPVEVKVKLARRPPISAQMLFLRQQAGGFLRGAPGRMPDARELQRKEEDEYFKNWYSGRLEKERGRKP